MKPWDAEEVKKVVAEAAAIAEASFAVQLHKDAFAEMAGNKPRVLIMDNDEATAKAVHETLGDRCEIVWACDAQHAMEELAKQDVSVVVSDLMLERPMSATSQDHQAAQPADAMHRGHLVQRYLALIELINQAQITRFLPKPVSKGILARNAGIHAGTLSCSTQSACTAKASQRRADQRPARKSCRPGISSIC